MNIYVGNLAYGITDDDLPWTPEEAAWYLKCDRRVMETDTPMLRIKESQMQAVATSSESPIDLDPAQEPQAPGWVRDARLAMRDAPVDFFKVSQGNPYILATVVSNMTIPTAADDSW